MNIRTEIDEERARYTLGIVCRYDLDTLIHVDRPDLQDHTNSIGIEVTWDTYEDEEQMFSWATKLDNNPDLITQKRLDKLMKLGISLDIKDGKITHASGGEWHPGTPTHLIGAINKKICKINNGGYAKFDEYGLFVFVRSMSISQDFDSYIHEVIHQLANNPKCLYRYIFLEQTYCICICDIKTQTFQRLTISKDDQEAIIDKSIEAIQKKYCVHHITAP